MLALKNIYFVFSKTVIILFITDLSLSVKSSYWSIISGDLIRSLNNLIEEQFAVLQIFMALSILIPAFPVSTCDKNCALIFNFYANSA